VLSIHAEKCKEARDPNSPLAKNNHLINDFLAVSSLNNITQADSLHLLQSMKYSYQLNSGLGSTKNFGLMIPPEFKDDNKPFASLF